MQGEQLSTFHGRVPCTPCGEAAAPCAEQGRSLLEIMVALSILAVTVGAAVPALLDLQARFRLEGQAVELVTDLHYVRSEALSRNQTMRISFHADAAGSCYVLHTGDMGDCSCASNGTAQCDDPDNTIVKSVGFAAEQRISLQTNVISMLFDPGRGTTTPAGSITLTGASGKTIRQIVNIAGRTRTCSPEGSVSGYKTC